MYSHTKPPTFLGTNDTLLGSEFGPPEINPSGAHAAMARSRSLFQFSMIRLLAVGLFFKHQRSKFSQTQCNKDEDRGVHPKVKDAYCISPLFPQIYIFSPPYFRKIYQFSPISVQFTSCLLNLRFFLPYFDHDAFMHHALHSLDAPVWRNIFKYRGLATLFSTSLLQNMRFTRAKNVLHLA